MVAQMPACGSTWSLGAAQQLVQGEGFVKPNRPGWEPESGHQEAWAGHCSAWSLLVTQAGYCFLPTIAGSPLTENMFTDCPPQLDPPPRVCWC